MCVGGRRHNGVVCTGQETRTGELRARESQEVLGIQTAPLHRNTAVEIVDKKFQILLDFELPKDIKVLGKLRGQVVHLHLRATELDEGGCVGVFHFHDNKWVTFRKRVFVDEILALYENTN